MLEKIQQKVQYITNCTGPGGACVSAAGALTLNEWLAIGGFLLAAASFLINWYYQHKRYLLEKAKYGRKSKQ